MCSKLFVCCAESRQRDQEEKGHVFRRGKTLLSRGKALAHIQEHTADSSLERKDAGSQRIIKIIKAAVLIREGSAILRELNTQPQSRRGGHKALQSISTERIKGVIQSELSELTGGALFED